MTQILNEEFLRELAEADPDLLSDLYQVFHPRSEEKIRDLERYLSEKNFDEFRKTAHALRSSSLNLGAVALPEILDRLERFPAGDEGKIPEDLNRAKNELENLKKEILKRMKPA